MGLSRWNIAWGCARRYLHEMIATVVDFEFKTNGQRTVRSKMPAVITFVEFQSRTKFTNSARSRRLIRNLQLIQNLSQTLHIPLNFEASRIKWLKYTTNLTPFSFSILVPRFDTRKKSDSTQFICWDVLPQYSHLITRRCREHNVYAELMPCTTNLKDLKFTPKGEPDISTFAFLASWTVYTGIILSGSPYSVYDKDSPHVDPAIYDLGVPILGICYGLQVRPESNHYSLDCWQPCVRA